MKIFPIYTALLGLAPLPAQEIAALETKWDVEIPPPIVADAPAKPAPDPEPIAFRVLSSQTSRMEVTEAPEMSGLPPITGTINVTVQTVENPGLPDLPPPLPALPPDDPAVIARFRELKKTYLGTDLVFVSATVYDRQSSLVRIYPNGQVGEEVVAWSNIDFNHFSGRFSLYRVKYGDGTFQDFGLLMGLGNEITETRKQLAAKHGVAYEEAEIPELPALATEGPTFVLVSGSHDSPAMDTLEQLHDLYRTGGERLKAEAIALEEARAARRAFLLANPSKPEDVTIRFWDRDQPTAER